MKTLLSLFILAFSVNAFSQKKSKLKVIETTVESFRITDSGDPKSTRSWRVAPELELDIYETAGNVVTFITDKETFEVKVSLKKPEYDFIILYKGDSCYTRVHYNQVPDYLDTLRKGQKYNLSEKRELPKFTYQDMNQPELVALRIKYNLDSIAGEASEIQQMINLMHWIHNSIKHDGQHDNPKVKNADNMIQACKDTIRGLNCRGLAITLNECYLAMGFKSRYATCMPRELEFDDCHVINMVYSNELQKWIYLDPTNNAYLMDEKGTLLSIEEVRQRMIDKKTIILNPDANWNNLEATNTEFYLTYYMAKNLYRIQCPVSSEYNLETRAPNKKVEYIELVPLNGMNLNPYKKDRENEETKSVLVEYVTSNPFGFWAKP
jgi:transglutaminase-like putative cysteine protease